MTALPKKKHTRSRTRRRRNSPSKRRGLPNLVPCSNCGKPKRTHEVCPHCNFYKK